MVSQILFSWVWKGSGIHHGEFFVHSGTNSFSHNWPLQPQVYIECALYFLLHEKVMLPRVYPCMTGLQLKTALLEDHEQGRNGGSWMPSGFVCMYVCMHMQQQLFNSCHVPARHGSACWIPPSCKYPGLYVSVPMRSTSSFCITCPTLPYTILAP